MASCPHRPRSGTGAVTAGPTGFLPARGGGPDAKPRMTGDFREPVIWLLLAIVARGIVEIVGFVLLDQDLIKHSQAEAGAGHELSVIYGRLGQHVPAPGQGQVKGPDNYAGRILATIFSLGIYMFWWFYNQMDEPNKHFTSNWAQEDDLVKAVQAVS
jgi:hypothetical protein